MTEKALTRDSEVIQALLQRVANLESLIQELSSRLEQLERTKQTKAFKLPGVYPGPQ